MNLKSLLDRPTLRWLIPGLSLKRWLLLMLFGMALMALGMGYIMVEFYREAALPPIFYYLTLQFLPRWLRAILIGGLGVGCTLLGFYRFNQSLLNSVREDDQPLVEKLWQQRITSQGPRVVAIGGGHGLAALLSGLKKKTTNITAIVTVADDGGSSGRLRRDFGTLPPGDFRMCISALADDESLVTQLFQYRFGKNRTGDSASADNGLSGHSFGNLFILAMAELTGSFEKALLESSKVVASTGRIVPSTLQDVVLCAEFKLPVGVAGAIGMASVEHRAPSQARGESSIGQVGLPIERVWLEPNDVPAFPEARRAILNAELVVMGPGSLFTSVMPNVLVPGIVEALRETQAKCVYVCNVATERGETDQFSLEDHVSALENHIGKGILDFVIVNNHIQANFAPPPGVTMVQPVAHLKTSSAKMVLADVVDDETPWRHHSTKLAEAVLSILF